MRTRYLLCLLGLLGLISACSSGSGSKQHQTQQAHHENIQTADTTLVGKRLYLEFDSNSSVVEYLSSRHLFWSSRDSVHGYKEGEDNYHAVRIGLHVFFVNWVESDGTTVSQVLDLKDLSGLPHFAHLLRTGRQPRHRHSLGQDHTDRGLQSPPARLALAHLRSL